MKWSAAIGKVCFLSGKSDAPQRRTHLRERVNTFSFCGTGGSFLFCRDRSLRPFAAIGSRKRRTRCNRLLRSADASVGRAAIVCCDRRTQASDALRSFVAIIRRDRRTQASDALQSFVAIGGREHWPRRDRSPRARIIPFCVPRRVTLFKEILRSLSLFARLRQTSRGRFAARCLSDGVLRRIPRENHRLGDIFFEFLKKCKK